ncbi:Elongator protein 3/MiaB/NifB [hydrothermal vent metagenome]|uniref:Elongator protein 3/MiaB/NifB n=1 Tax=hydrothermal vent metagenome TaxID=652676 RepID=A0A3B1CSK4_9ZZZZ
MKNQFRIVLIKPSHYDDAGYVIRWHLSSIPSNSLACLYAITEQVRLSGALGEAVDLVIDVYDETNQKIPLSKILKQFQAPDVQGIICMVGVQTNQFPRAVDLSRPFLAKNIPVLIGGFHVGGCLSMLEKIPDDLSEAMNDGITLVAGEVEQTWGDILKDALSGALKPLYNFLDDLPGLQAQSAPILPTEVVSRYVGSLATFDAGRGCPFTCSFCTIINVQGRKSRFRTADDVEAIVRENWKNGIRRYFVTDDDFARNRNWEAIFDRLIYLRENEGMNINMILQVDTACHRIPRFIQKAGRAGCHKVFIGLENINAAALKSTGKKQNHVEQYRDMLQDWRRAGVLITAGYIVGFPNDTKESVLRDIEVIKKELPIDLLEFFMLTPLPGSEDHQTLVKNGVQLESDMNRYDLEHPCVEHPLMSPAEWRECYDAAWHSYYSDENVAQLFKRRFADGNSVRRLQEQVMWFYGSILFEKLHPLQSGILRRKSRSERRPGLAKENVVVFYLKCLLGITTTVVGLLKLHLKLDKMRKRIQNDPQGKHYQDMATRPTCKKTEPLVNDALVLPLSGSSGT